jgi:hypothetical protein
MCIILGLITSTKQRLSVSLGVPYVDARRPVPTTRTGPFKTSCIDVKLEPFVGGAPDELKATYFAFLRSMISSMFHIGQFALETKFAVQRVCM